MVSVGGVTAKGFEGPTYDMDLWSDLVSVTLQIMQGYGERRSPRYPNVRTYVTSEYWVPVHVFLTLEEWVTLITLICVSHFILCFIQQLLEIVRNLLRLIMLYNLHFRMF